MSNLATVQKMYEAFSRRDIPAILANVADNIDWEYGGTEDIPWLTPRKGMSGAKEFFVKLQDLDIKKFEPKMIFEKDNIVVALFDFDATVKATGKRFVEEDEVHIFYFDNKGKVARFRHRADTHLQYEALHSADRPRDMKRTDARPTM